MVNKFNSSEPVNGQPVPTEVSEPKYLTKDYYAVTRGICHNIIPGKKVKLISRRNVFLHCGTRDVAVHKEMLNGGRR